MGGIFAKPAPVIVQQAAPAVPAPTPVATLPTVDDATVRRARQLKQAEIMQRGGRRSTILTSAETRPSGDTYGDGVPVRNAAGVPKGF